MSADTLGTIAVAGYALAVVFAIAAVVFYFTRHVRDVRDELTGKAEREAIAQIRAGEGGRVMSGAMAVAAGGQRMEPAGAGSGSLHVRLMGHKATTGVQAPAVPAESEAGTTLIGTDDSEAGTTLIGSVSRPATTGAIHEVETTLLGMGNPSGDVLPNESSEMGTTLLGSGDANA